MQILRVFKNKKKSNAIVFDHLNRLFLIAWSPRLLPDFTNLFNSVSTMPSFPDEWMQSKIIPIPKIQANCHYSIPVQSNGKPYS